MDSSSAIFGFSGTGNSLYAAKLLSAGLDNLPLVQITNTAPPGAVGGKGEKVGFVFPSYFGNLPRAVRSFVEKAKIMPGTYIFAVVTMGAVGQVLQPSRIDREMTARRAAYLPQNSSAA